jgi:chemotaxis protein methyltransferase WspC
MKKLLVMEQILAETMGLDTATTGGNVIARAVAAAMKRSGETDMEAYTERLKASEDERQALLEEIVVPETWFFRDVGPFEYLKAYVRNIWRPSAAGRPLRILSAPCSTGEEPYSIVMALLDAGLSPTDFHVDAVDISARALSAARQACYSRNSFRSPLTSEQMRCFSENGKSFRLSDSIVQAVHFFQDNLACPHRLAPDNPYHVIFCRNMLIYLHGDARQAVFSHLERRLLPGGVLFSGHTETVFWMQNGYLPIRWARAFALQKPIPTRSATCDRKPAFVSGAARREDGLCTPLACKSDGPREGSGMSAILRAGMSAADNGKSSIGAFASKAQPHPASDTSPVNKTAPATPTDQRLHEARRLADQGLLDPAAALCRQYLQQAAADAEAHCLLGLIHKASGASKDAESCFQKALYLDPDHYESLIHLNLLYQQQGDDRKADLYRERMLRSERRRRDADA